MSFPALATASRSPEGLNATANGKFRLVLGTEPIEVAVVPLIE